MKSQNTIVIDVSTAGYKNVWRAECEVTVCVRTSDFFATKLRIIHNCFTFYSRLAVQHERKPIVDKKETSSSTSTAQQRELQSRDERSAAANSVLSTIVNSFGAVHPHLNVRHDLLMASGHDGNGTAGPVRFNFGELASSLSKKSAASLSSYQRSVTSPPSSVGAQMKSEDDTSMDNASGPLLGGLNVNINQIGVGSGGLAPTLNEGTLHFLQQTIERNIINESLDLIKNLQFDSDLDMIDDDKTDETTTANNNRGYFDMEGDFDMTIVNDKNVAFNLITPTLLPAYLNLHYLCECGSRLLFLSVYWFKNIQPFKQLPDDLQTELIKRSWAELFIIGLAQVQKKLAISTILSTFVTQIKTTIISNGSGGGPTDIFNKVGTTEKIKKSSEHILRLQSFLRTMSSMDVDDYEYAYMRLICLFSVDRLGGGGGVADQAKRNEIERIQEISHKGLKHYIDAGNNMEDDLRQPTMNSSRFPKLLLTLPILRTFDPQIIEDLFFSNLIGPVQIDIVIPYILKLSNGIKSEMK